jgi:N-acyl homoserine lactone hydrolase
VDAELYLFDSGTLALNGVEVPVPFYLVRHPAGTVVIDGGNPLAVAQDARRHWGALADVFEVHMTEAQHCAAQLELFGVGPGDVSHIVQTHLHIDHTGALGHFPEATVVVHGQELEAARAADDPTRSGYVRGDYEQPGLRWRELRGDTDLFGDGVVRLLETPGHAAGHMSVLLRLAESGPILLTADACDSRAQWERRDPVRALHSRQQAASSLERLHKVADDTGALLIFGHDPENWAQRKQAPQGYR